MKILGIETSCDETSVSIVENGVKVISNTVTSSTSFFEKFGGVVPEIAARHQLVNIIPVIKDALKPFSSKGTIPQIIIKNNINAIAVTIGPGLMGSLIIGVEMAKTISQLCELPIIPVNHVIAHMYANFINNKNITFPAISLVASGGHTELFLVNSTNQIKWLGGTIDDAAGEALDKTARIIGLGIGGGKALEEIIVNYKNNSKNKITFPRPMLHEKNYNFSFSGLKTAVKRDYDNLPSLNKISVDDQKAFAFEILNATTDTLVKKTLYAVNHCNAKSVLISGGVAANTMLREKFIIELGKIGVNFYAPEKKYCTDNAAYIASCAYFIENYKKWQEIIVDPNLSVEL